jgi:hypothetical protein
MAGFTSWAGWSHSLRQENAELQGRSQVKTVALAHLWPAFLQAPDTLYVAEPRSGLRRADKPSRPIDPDRIRRNHDQTGPSGQPEPDPSLAKRFRRPATLRTTGSSLARTTCHPNPAGRRDDAAMSGAGSRPNHTYNAPNRRFTLPPVGLEPTLGGF